MESNIFHKVIADNEFLVSSTRNIHDLIGYRIIVSDLLLCCCSAPINQLFGAFFFFLSHTTIDNTVIIVLGVNLFSSLADEEFNFQP